MRMATESNPPLGPAAKLKRGDSLGERWTIDRKMTRNAHGTGGTFSVAYLATDSHGNFGFVKAMDFHQGLRAPNPAGEIQLMTEAFNFEKGVLEYCQGHRLSRVVQLIDSGVHRPDPGDVADVVQYLVFEVAQGDIRAYIANERIWERAVALRTIHGVAAALQQLQPGPNRPSRRKALQHLDVR